MKTGNMDFRASNFTVSILLLMAFTVWMMIIRNKKPLENNWPLIYWVLILMVSVMNPQDTWDFRIVLIGLGAGLLLRFEFMNKLFTRIVKTVEFAAWIYVLVRGFNIITTY